MKFSVGTNWDFSLIDSLAKIPEVREVYGSSNATPVGTGRPSFILGKISKDDMALYIKRLHERGIKFNYTLNAPCLNNLEFTKDAHIELIDQLEWLVSIGIDGVTVSIPYLLEIIKKRFPQLHAKVSIIAHVNSVQRARYFENLGADELMIDFLMNRDFKQLEKIQNSVKCQLAILLNDACISGCPYRYYHYNVSGHASQTNHPTKGFFVDYCAIRCTIERLKNPRLALSARWVRPEDIKFYEEIGFDTFKISGRRMSAKWIERAVKAYASRRLDGNLSDILDYSILGVDEEMNSPDFETMEGAAELNINSLFELANFQPQKPYIDNKSLNGFLEFYKKKECTGICDQCNHCEKYAKVAVKVNEVETKKQLDMYNKLLDELTSSKAFLGAGEVPEIDKSELPGMLWPPKVKQDFKTILSFAPEAIRPVAEQMITKIICENTKKRGANEISEEDMVAAFLKDTPILFRKQMLKSLKETGISLDKYGLKL